MESRYSRGQCTVEAAVIMIVLLGVLVLLKGELKIEPRTRQYVPSVQLSQGVKK